ncbi:MAG: hypothetical protein KGJ06_01485 [Pseudomonadota bacterium]|nr:hypothetical protein [Pseudomonadota bacterium]
MSSRQPAPDSTPIDDPGETEHTPVSDRHDDTEVPPPDDEPPHIPQYSATAD